MQTKTQKIIPLGIILALILLGVIIGFALTNHPAEAENRDYYQTNADGLTYGSAADVPQGAKQLDMITAVATNGKTGYIYTKDLDAARPMAANPEEAVKMMNERNAWESRRFVELITEDYSLQDKFSDDLALLIYQSVQELLATKEPGTAWEYSKADAENFANLAGIDASLLPEGEALRDYFYGIFIKIQTEHSAEIPVYLEDGKTRIGVFRAGS